MVTLFLTNLLHLTHSILNLYLKPVTSMKLVKLELYINLRETGKGRNCTFGKKKMFF